MGNVLDCGTSQSNQTEEMQDASINGSVPGKFIVQESTPFSESLFWTLQRKYYEDNNIKAFASSEVPSFVTSNSYVANVYADMILKYLLDWYDTKECDLTQPVYILEAGAGHGKLGYLILKRLIELKEFWPTKVTKPFVYVLSDFTESTIKWWNSIGFFDVFKNEGYIDFSIFDCEKDTKMHLELSNITYEKNQIKNPLLVISNYLFDSLCHDVYLFENNQVYKGMLTLSSNHNEILPPQCDIIPRLQYTWNYQLVTNCDTLYKNEDINGIVRYYKQRVKSAIIPIPISSINFLQTLSDLTGNKLVIIAGDSGNIKLEEYVKKDLFISINGAFSLPVNFHCLDLYIQNRGGEVYSSPYLDGFRTCIYTFGMNKLYLPRFKWSITRHLNTFTPESFFTLQKCMKEESSTTGKSALALLRLSGFDGDIFIKYKQILIDRGLISTVCANEDLLRDIQKILDAYYPLQKNKDVCFEIGRMYMGLKEYDKAIRSFKLSNKFCSEHHVTYHNIGMCYEHLHLYLDAKEAFEKALSIKPSYRESKIMLTKLTPFLEHDTIKDETN